jgi:hypothetical protein
MNIIAPLTIVLGFALCAGLLVFIMLLIARSVTSPSRPNASLTDQPLTPPSQPITPATTISEAHLPYERIPTLLSIAERDAVSSRLWAMPERSTPRREVLLELRRHICHHIMRSLLACRWLPIAYRIPVYRRLTDMVYSHGKPCTL